MAGKLTNEHREFLVREFACFSTAVEAVKALEAKFGVKITPQAAEYYHPELKASHRGRRKLGKKWRDLFATLRAAFLEDVSHTVPAAHKSVRIKHLADAAETMRAKGNLIGMANLYERIAKEVGDVHTNRRELSGPKGKPIQYQDVSEMTDEQVQDELRAMFGLEEGVDVHPMPATKQ